MPESMVVTGCGRGIGLEIATALVHAGYFVVGVERDADVAHLAADIFANNGDVVIADTADPSTHHTAAARALSAAPLVGWVNNAALNSPSNLHSTSAGEVRRLIDVNLLGYFWGCSAAVRSFLSRRLDGAIVNVSSIHGTAAFRNAAAYGMSKAGVDALTRYVAVEYGPFGVRANSVAPGGVRTRMADALIDLYGGRATAEQATRDALPPLGRIGETAEIAAVVLFLLSASASYVTGQTIVVDGGLSARLLSSAASPDLSELGPTEEL